MKVVVDIKIYYKQKNQTSAFNFSHFFLSLFIFNQCPKRQKNPSQQMLQTFLLSLEIKKQHKTLNKRKFLKKLLKRNQTLTLKSSSKSTIMICKVSPSWRHKNSLIILFLIHLKSLYQKVPIKNLTKNKI